jgi:hypothetical protein
MIRLKDLKKADLHKKTKLVNKKKCIKIKVYINLKKEILILFSKVSKKQILYLLIVNLNLSML